MKVPPKYLAYGSVLAIGAIALALDSAFPPASAAAAVEPPVAESTAAALASAAAAYSAPLDTGLAPLADRLSQLNERSAPGEPHRDVFTINTQAWGLDDAPEALAPQQAGANPHANLRVSAIIVNTGEGRAVINGTLVKVGDWVSGGYLVTAIGQRTVKLDYDGHTITVPWNERP